jgi:predicted XRE-type DNA-binding protein
MPAIIASMIAELRARYDVPLMRCKWALKESGGDVDKAVELLRQSGDIPAGPAYGTDLTRALGTVPGFAEGYESAQRQQLFGKQLRELREAKGLSQAQLAELSSVDQGDISRFESGKWGKRGISYEMLDRILPVLGMRLEHRVLPAEKALASDQRWQKAAVAMSDLL